MVISTLPLQCSRKVIVFRFHLILVVVGDGVLTSFHLLALVVVVVIVVDLSFPNSVSGRR